MDFSVSSSSKKRLAAGSAKADGRLVPGQARSVTASPVSMYNSPPVGVEVSIEDFEEFALDRLRVLKTIEEAKARGRSIEEVDVLVGDLWYKHMRVPGKPEESWRKDIISHFVLRLGYCISEDQRRWFLAQECTLFRHRFRQETAEAQRMFLEDHGLPYKAITSAELQEVRDDLEQVWRSLNVSAPVDTLYYKVPFEEVPDLVSSRRVLLRRGFAYVPREQLAAIVVGQFRAVLSKALTITKRKWDEHIRADERDRLTPIVETLSTRYFGEDYSDPNARGVGAVGLGDLDRLALESFPMCMRHLFLRLREDHHLKHGGRMQLGLFLKGVGLRLEDALSFWKSEFSQKVGPEKFDKEYSYSIRHNYGKEGKRTDYTPYSCNKIIQSTPSVGDHHGCPFRHFSEENLAALLQRVGVSAKAATEVKEKARQRHYQIACGMTFGATQGQPCPDAGVSHPNQYFDWSQKAKQGINLSAPQRTPNSDKAS